MEIGVQHTKGFYLDLKSMALPLLLFLVLGFIGDLAIAFFPSLLGINLLLRGVGIIPVIFLTFREVKGIRIYFMLSLGLVLFVMNYFLYWTLVPHDKMGLSYFATSLIWAVKNYGMIIFFMYYGFSLKSKKDFDLTMQLLVLVSLAYVFLQLLGPIIKIDEFLTYGVGGYRSGYKGIVYAQNEATVFYFFSAVIIVHFFKSKVGILKYIVIGLLALSLLILGTKAGILMMPVLVFYFFYIEVGLRKSLVLVFVFLLVSSMIFIYLYNSNDLFKSAVDLSVGYYKYRLDKGMDLVTIFTSGRDTLLKQTYFWSTDNMPTFLLYGGVPVSYKFVEMDFFDKVLVFGLPFTIWFYYLIYAHLGGRDNKFLFFSFLLISLFSGHVTTSVVAAPFLAGAFYSAKERAFC